MPPPLEDNASDILGKAMRGQGFDAAALAAKAGISSAAWKDALAGAVDEHVLARLAEALGLDAGALVALARGAWKPAPVELAGLEAFTTPFDDITVNAYLVCGPEGRGAAAFDSGADATPMLDRLQRLGARLEFLFLTHTHGDHVLEVDRIAERTGARVLVSAAEPLAGAETFEPGASFSVGGLSIGTRLTRGHSRGGTTYVVEGLGRPVAVTGDALFAGSMGGAMVSYADALRTNREQIFTLPDDTVLCPGHGPMTTVGEERRHNPFFAGKAAVHG